MLISILILFPFPRFISHFLLFILFFVRLLVLLIFSNGFSFPSFPGGSCAISVCLLVFLLALEWKFRRDLVSWLSCSFLGPPGACFLAFPPHITYFPLFSLLISFLSSHLFYAFLPPLPYIFYLLACLPYPRQVNCFLPVYLPTCLCLSLSASTFPYLPECLPVYLAVTLLVLYPPCLNTCLSVLSICPFFHYRK